MNHGMESVILKRFGSDSDAAERDMKTRMVHVLVFEDSLAWEVSYGTS